MSGWATLRAHQAPVRTVDFDQSGLRLVSGDEAGFVCWWSLETRRPILLWQAHENALLATKFWRDSLIVTHGRDNKIHIWKADPQANEKLPLIYSQDVNASNFCSVALASSSNLSKENASSIVLATPASIASERVDVYRIDLENNAKLSRPFKALDASEALSSDTQLEDEANMTKRRGLLGTVMALEFSEKWLVAGYESGHVAVFARDTGEVRKLVQPHKSPVLSLKLSSKSSNSNDKCATELAFVSSADRKLTRIDLTTGEACQVARLEHKGVATVSICNTLMVTSGWDGKVRSFDVVPDGRGLEEIDSFPGGRQSGITAATISRVDPGPKRRSKPSPQYWIAVAGKDGRIGLFAIENALAKSL